MASPTGFEPVSSDRKSDVLGQTRRWGQNHRSDRCKLFFLGDDAGNGRDLIA